MLVMKRYKRDSPDDFLSEHMSTRKLCKHMLLHHGGRVQGVVHHGGKVQGVVVGGCRGRASWWEGARGREKSWIAHTKSFVSDL